MVDEFKIYEISLFTHKSRYDPLPPTFRQRAYFIARSRGEVEKLAMPLMESILDSHPGEKVLFDIFPINDYPENRFDFKVSIKPLEKSVVN